MSIVLVMVLSLLSAVLICVIAFGIYESCINWRDPSRFAAGVFAVALISLFVGGTFLGVGLVTESERVYIAKYESQKATIECSLECDELSGLERVQLVNKAVDLNGELAERKAKFERWHYVTFDDSMYDGVEPIIFE